MAHQCKESAVVVPFVRSKLVALAAVATVALAGCSSAGTPTPPPAAPATGASSSSSVGSGAALRTADSALGTIVVDASGRTVYVYDKDTQNATSSACTGPCATAWPAVPADPAHLTADGVTGTLGSITGVDGKPQLTLNGWPLYYFAKDAKPGDVTGQAVQNVWWVVGPGGAKITQASSGGY